jgi:hypothetical protein
LNLALGSAPIKTNSMFWIMGNLPGSRLVQYNGDT